MMWVKESLECPSCGLEVKSCCHKENERFQNWMKENKDKEIWENIPAHACTHPSYYCGKCEKRI